MAGNALKKITQRAKQIVKRHPNKKWSTAIKEAGREYRSGAIAGVKKKKPAKKRTSNRIARARAVGARLRAHSVGSAPATGGSLESQLKRQLKEKAGWYLASAATATTKKEKTNLRKKAAEELRKLRALK